MIYERIRNLNQTEWKSGLEEILKNSPEEFPGYAGFIRSLAVTAPSAPAVFTALVDKDSQQFTYRSIKIRELPDKDFRKLLTAYNDKLPPKLTSSRSDSTLSGIFACDMDGAKLKQEVLHFFSPFHPETTRRSDQTRPIITTLLS